MHFCEKTLLALAIVSLGGFSPRPVYAGDGLSASQLLSEVEAENKHRDAADKARNAGRNSIGRGMRHMKMGHHHHHPPMVHLGALEIARGLLGLLAAKKAEELAEQQNRNASGLQQITDGSSGTTPSAGGLNQSGVSSTEMSGQSYATGEGGATGQSEKIERVDLGSPETKEAIGMLEDHFGYSKKEILAGLKEGKDEKALLMDAPKNALTKADIKAANKEGDSIVTDEKATPIVAAAEAPAGPSAGGGGAAGGASSASKLGSATAEGQSVMGTPSAAIDMKLGDAKDLRERLIKAHGAGGDDDDDDASLSPEVRAALAARRTEEKENARWAASQITEELNLFQVVHRKYNERENNMRWGTPLRTAGADH